MSSSVKSARQGADSTRPPAPSRWAIRLMLGFALLAMAGLWFAFWVVPHDRMMRCVAEKWDGTDAGWRAATIACSIEEGRS